MVRDISLEEVKLHNTEKDCWIIVHGKVYDVTKYLNDHPGGVEIVTDLAGQDATTDYDDVGHTQEAHEILEKFLIGHLKTGAPIVVTPVGLVQKKEESKPAPPATNSAPAPQKPSSTVSQPVKPKPVQQPEDDSTMMIVAGAVVAAVVAGFMLYRRSAKA